MTPGNETFTLYQAFACALAGIAQAAKGRNFRIQLAVAVLAFVLGVAFRISLAEWLAVVVCIGLVLGGECLNTAIEAAVDLASPAKHPMAKIAKDAAAGSVLLFSAAAFVVGVCVFAPRLLGVVA